MDELDGTCPVWCQLDSDESGSGADPMHETLPRIVELLDDPNEVISVALVRVDEIDQRGVHVVHPAEIAVTAGGFSGWLSVEAAGALGACLLELVADALC